MNAIMTLASTFALSQAQALMGHWSIIYSLLNVGFEIKQSRQH